MVMADSGWTVFRGCGFCSFLGFIFQGLGIETDNDRSRSLRDDKQKSNDKYNCQCRTESCLLSSDDEVESYGLG
jgi:hypothetical protein